MINYTVLTRIDIRIFRNGIFNILTGITFTIPFTKINLVSSIRPIDSWRRHILVGTVLVY